jgi:starch synthase
MSKVEPLKILMVASEAAPFAKTGGLADMVSTLSVELSRVGHDVRILMPRYYFLPREGMFKHWLPLGVPLGAEEYWNGLYESKIPGSDVPVYFLDHEELYGRDGVYGSRTEPFYKDNAVRFAHLSAAAVQMCRFLQWIPDIIHSHDWPTALVPVYLHNEPDIYPFAETGTVMTIHNLGYQGVFDQKEFFKLGLMPAAYQSSGLDDHGHINFMKAGLSGADMITTVSPHYANEIQTPKYGFHLDDLLRARSKELTGILNGMDYDLWNPKSDPLLPFNYSRERPDNKALVKTVLQKEAGLEVNPNTPLFGIVSRLAEQKGFDELCSPSHGSLYDICSDLDLQFVILGTGESWCEDELYRLSQRLPNLKAYLKFDERLAHLIEAGSDFFLMPSRYEPCGLNQMYSLRYGAIPIVTQTGGFLDSVEPYNPRNGQGTGFMIDQTSPSAIYQAVDQATKVFYSKPDHIKALRYKGMGVRFTWKKSAAEYEQVYANALKKKRPKLKAENGKKNEND